MAVRHQRQNDKGRCSKDQRVVQLVFRDHFDDKVVEPRLHIKQHRHGHGDRGGGLRCLHAHAAQEGRQDKNDFRGQARILILGAPIGDRDQRGNAGRQDGKQPDAPKGKGDSARDRGDGERPDACRSARRAFTLAPLTLRPNQRSDRDGTDEIQEGWVKEQCSLHASRTGLCSGAMHKAPMMRAY